MRNPSEATRNPHAPYVVRMQIHGMAPWPLEAGAQFVHGAEPHKFNRVVKDFGIKFREVPWPDWWYFGRERRMVKDDDVDDEVDKVGLVFWGAGGAWGRGRREGLAWMGGAGDTYVMLCCCPT